jgi:hypothetical protein
MRMPTLRTEQLLIRPFTLDDASTYDQINTAVGWVDETMTAEANLLARREWLELEACSLSAGFLGQTSRAQSENSLRLGSVVALATGSRPSR